MWSGKTIDWNNWDTYIVDLVCRCANESRARNYSHFSIQYYGNCQVNIVFFIIFKMKLFSVLSFYSFPYKRLEHVPRYAVLKVYYIHRYFELTIMHFVCRFDVSLWRKLL